MRRIGIAFWLLAFLPFGVSAQADQTLTGPYIESGGFGAPVVKMTSMMDEFAVLLGGRGGWILNRTFVLGGGGYGLVNDVYTDVLDQYYRPGKIRFGYGGLDLEVIIASSNLVHFTLQGLIGGGGVGYRFDPYHHVEYDAVFVAEPGANVELNITPFMRLTAGATYRFVEDVDLVELTSADLSNWTGTIMLKFGKFGGPRRVGPQH